MLRSLVRRTESRDAQMSWPDYLRLWEQFGFNGNQYVVPGSFAELTAAQGATNAIVAAAIAVRLMVFSEARFLWQRWENSRPGEFFGTEALTLIEQPWPGGGTSDLLARMEVDASLYGNSYWWATGGQLVRLDPTRVVVSMSAITDPETGATMAQRLAGYHLVTQSGEVLETFLPGELVHYAPLPDPVNPYRGRSWLSAVLSDVTADDQFTTYKHSFLRNGATPAMIVKFEPGVSPEAAKEFRERLESRHRGSGNAFNTLYLGAGADARIVGSNLSDLNIKAVQGAGETRIASAAGVPASILGISEGLAGSALNSGNYTAARRRFADGTIRPLWRSAANALSQVLVAPSRGVRLWYDDRDVPFLQEDVLDNAEISQRNAQSIRTLVDGGFDPDSVVQAIDTSDLLLLRHSGNLSVQLQPAGTVTE